MSNKQIFQKIQNINTQIMNLEHLKASINKNSQDFSKIFNEQCKENFDTISEHIQKNIVQLEKNLQIESQKLSNEQKLDSQEIVNDILDAWNKRKAEVNIYNWVEDVNSPDYDENNQEDLEWKTKHFNETLGTNFTAKDITSIEVVVESNSRSDLWLVRAYLAPGFAEATFDTGKVGWGLAIMLNSDFRKALKHEISQNC